MDERFIAIRTVTWSRIRGCSTSRDVISLSRRGGNRRRMQLDGSSNLRKKSRESLLQR